MMISYESSITPFTPKPVPKHWIKEKVEQLRQQEGKWRWYLSKAQQYSGALKKPKEKQAKLDKEPLLRRIMRKTNLTHRERRTGIIQACEKKADKLEAERNKLEAYAGNELTEEIKKN